MSGGSGLRIGDIIHEWKAGDWMDPHYRQLLDGSGRELGLVLSSHVDGGSGKPPMVYVGNDLGGRRLFVPLPELKTGREADRFVDSFYRPSDGGQLEEGVTDDNFWVDRWAMMQNRGFCTGCEPWPENYGCQGKLWYLLGGSENRWVLPVRISKNIDHFSPVTAVPTPMRRFGRFKTLLAPVRGTATPYSKEPVEFSCRFKGTAGAKRVIFDFTLLLHQCLNPNKWHHNIWKHVLAKSPSARPEENGFWEVWGVANDQNTSADGECKEKDDGHACGCSRHVFERVNNQFEPLMTAYWHKLLDFLDQGGNAGECIFYPEGRWYDVKINFSGSIPGGDDIQGIAHLHGWHYGKLSKNMVVHANPSTFYLASQKGRADVQNKYQHERHVRKVGIAGVFSAQRKKKDKGDNR